MRNIFTSIMLVCATCSFAQLQVRTTDLTTNDLVYDSVTDRIYVSIPSANGSNGNSIGVINPETLALEKTVFMGSEPTVLAISDNGQYIYAGFTASSTVRRFDVATQEAGLQFTLGTDDSSGAFYVEDMEVVPGQPTAIAVSRRNQGISPKHEGVAIYDDGVVRPTTTPDHTGSNQIEFTSSTSMIGYNNESTEYGIRRLSVNAGGVSNVSVTDRVLRGFNLRFIYHDNRMYATDGTVVDISSTPFVAGSFANATGPVTFDTANNSVGYATNQGSGSIVFNRYNSQTFLLIDSTAIPGVFGQAKSLITCGDGCYAFNTDSNKIVVIKDSTLGIDEVVTSDIQIYPNPASDYIFLSSNSGDKVSNITLTDLNGRNVINQQSVAESIDISSLQQGMYLATITVDSGRSITKKIIKY
jgi:hypothetical protein